LIDNLEGYSGINGRGGTEGQKLLFKPKGIYGSLWLAEYRFTICGTGVARMYCREPLTLTLFDSLEKCPTNAQKFITIRQVVN